MLPQLTYLLLVVFVLRVKTLILLKYKRIICLRVWRCVQKCQGEDKKTREGRFTKNSTHGPLSRFLKELSVTSCGLNRQIAFALLSWRWIICHLHDNMVCYNMGVTTSVSFQRWSLVSNVSVVCDLLTSGRWTFTVSLWSVPHSCHTWCHNDVMPHSSLGLWLVCPDMTQTFNHQSSCLKLTHQSEAE